VEYKEAWKTYVITVDRKERHSQEIGPPLTAIAVYEIPAFERRSEKTLNSQYCQCHHYAQY
jgi:hypothetical protein